MNAPLPPGPPPRFEGRATVAALADLPDRIDVRTPSEFAEDHLPGAVNMPVLSDAERAQVGTIYVQDSAFEARKVGAAIVARNIAGIIETYARGQPRDWHPLVYCWRGGQRSRSLTHVLCEVGWRAVQLDGGYRAYRRHVVATLSTLPSAYRYRLVCGLTGSGKSRLLAALALEGAQVLDLERMARHRGSLLGDIPGDPQPSQKAFETEVLATLAAFDRTRPVYVESESRKIGALQVPESLLEAMRASPCVRVDTPQSLRVALLKEEYAHFLEDGAALAQRLVPLTPILGKKTLARWSDAAAQGEHDALIAELLAQHYDPMYAHSIEHNFPCYPDATVARVQALDADAFRALARHVIAQERATAVIAP